MLRLSACTARLYRFQLDLHHIHGSRQKAPAVFRSLSTSVPKQKQAKGKASKSSERDSDTAEPTVRWYQQLLPWSSERKPSDPALGFASGEQYDEAKFIKDQIEKNDAEIREMAGDGGQTMVEPLLAKLPKEEAQRIRDAIVKSDLEEEQEEEEAAAIKRQLDEQLLPKKEELEIKWKLPPEQETYLRRLNADLLQASSELSNHALRKKLWHSYVRCKSFLPPFLHLVPREAWDVLWASQHSAGLDDPRWGHHVITLSEDMEEAGMEMNLYQRILYVEGLRAMGHQEQAIVQWKGLKDFIQDDVKASAEYELLGVRLFASQGDPELAEKIAKNYLISERKDESRILIPIMHAWAQRGDDPGIRHAWALYLQYRTFAESSITIEDYDNISAAFLSVGRTDIALAVFKDMMLTGERSDYGSLELYKKSMAMMGGAQNSAISVEELNRISMTGLITLPRKFQNKYFYASWLKRLLGFGEVTAAGQVIELMYERHVMPDAKHLNGMIGAWLRSPNDNDREKAEKLAWAMIHERLDFVSLRRKGHDPESSTDLGPPTPVHLSRKVARATVETFALLLQYYAQRSQDKIIQSVDKTLALAELSPNVYYNNHLLYYDLRQGQHQAAWIKYKEMFHTVKPDLETFACLWDCEKAHLGSLTIHKEDRFPGPRRIMYEMISWFEKLSDRNRAAAREEFSRDLYDQIIRCMGLASDAEGILVAMYALKQTFDFYPEVSTMRMVNLHISRMRVGLEAKIIKPGRNRYGRKQREANATKLSQVLGIVVGQREQDLVKAGLDDVTELEDDIQDQERLFNLAEFIRTVLRRTRSDEGAVKQNINKAAWDMGVAGIPMEDPIHSYIEKKSKGMYKLEAGL